MSRKAILKRRTLLLSGVVAVLVIGGSVAAVIRYRHRPAAQPQTAVSYYQNKQYSQALAVVSQDISKQPTGAENYNFRANIERDQGNTAAAETDYAQAVKLNSGYLAPYINWASMEINLGHRDQAKTIIKDGLALFPGQVTLLALSKEIGG